MCTRYRIYQEFGYFQLRKKFSLKLFPLVKRRTVVSYYDMTFFFSKIITDTLNLYNNLINRIIYYSIHFKLWYIARMYYMRCNIYYYVYIMQVAAKLCSIYDQVFYIPFAGHDKGYCICLIRINHTTFTIKISME